MLDSYDTLLEVSTANTNSIADVDREKLEEDLKKIQEEISDLRGTLSLKLQQEAQIKSKLGYTLLNEIQSDLQTGLKTFKESTTYHKTVEVLASAKDRTSNVVSETKDIVSKKLHEAKESNAYKEVENKVGSLVSTMKDAFFFAAYGPPPISDEEYEEPIGAVSVSQNVDKQQ